MRKLISLLTTISLCLFMRGATNELKYRKEETEPSVVKRNNYSK